MGEFVCPDIDAYVERAIGLGRNPHKLAAPKRRLAAGRDTCLRFDTPRLTRHLADLFRRMWNDFPSGALPVPDLTKLDVYFDLGADLNLETVDTLSDEV